MKDVTLPGPDADDQWCELLIHTATPEIGKQLDDGIPPASRGSFLISSVGSKPRVISPSCRTPADSFPAENFGTYSPRPPAKTR
ncbi:hypothetical protein [Streptomyces sp. NPDC048710]|uniref:hypothetical protein n=1 Tax=unclassified Streptomyces TaxID=2593676 RepID=UPI0037130ACC